MTCSTTIGFLVVFNLLYCTYFIEIAFSALGRSHCYSSSWAASFFFALFIILASTEERSSSRLKSVSISVFRYPLFMLWSFWYKITVGYCRILKLWQIDFPFPVSQSTLFYFTKTTLKTREIAQTLKHIQKPKMLKHLAAPYIILPIFHRNISPSPNYYNYVSNLEFI